MCHRRLRFRALGRGALTVSVLALTLTACSTGTEPDPSSSSSQSGEPTSQASASGSSAKHKQSNARANSEQSSTHERTSASNSGSSSTPGDPTSASSAEDEDGATENDDRQIQAPDFDEIRFGLLEQLSTLKTFHASGTVAFKGLTTDFSGVFHRSPHQAMSLEGHISSGKANGQLDLILTDELVYLRGDHDFWDTLGAGAGSEDQQNIARLADSFVKLTPDQAQLDNLQPTQLNDKLLRAIDWDSFTEAGEPVKLLGDPVIRYMGADDTVLYTDHEGQTLEAVDARIDGHMVRFTRLNQTALIPQPSQKDVIDWQAGQKSDS